MGSSLAIDGGVPVRTSPMPPWPAPGDREITAVTEVLRSGRINYWTGDQGRSFEAEYAVSVGRNHAIAVANGTLALELGLRAFGIGVGDEVIVPARTFIATAGAVVAVGATPVVCDIDMLSGNMTAGTVDPQLTRRTRAIIPVHVGGWPVDLEPILALAAEHDLVVIEDCAQAHAGSHTGRPVGALGSHAAAFSFCQDKILPTGEGGMLVLDDTAAHERAWAYKEHGKSLSKINDREFMSDNTSYKWLVDSFGTNFRMDEMTAAVGRVGLALLPEWHAARTRNGLRLAAALEGVKGLGVPLPANDVRHAFYRLYSLVDIDALASGWTRDRIAHAISAEGTPCQYGTCAEIYREQAFATVSQAPSSRLPGAANAHDRSLAFFVHPTLTDNDIDDTADAVRKVMAVAAR